MTDPLINQAAKIISKVQSLTPTRGWLQAESIFIEYTDESVYYINSALDPESVRLVSYQAIKDCYDVGDFVIPETPITDEEIDGFAVGVER